MNEHGHKGMKQGERSVEEDRQGPAFGQDPYRAGSQLTFVLSHTAMLNGDLPYGDARQRKGKYP